MQTMNSRQILQFKELLFVEGTRYFATVKTIQIICNYRLTSSKHQSDKVISHISSASNHLKVLCRSQFSNEHSESKLRSFAVRLDLTSPGTFFKLGDLC